MIRQAQINTVTQFLQVLVTGQSTVVLNIQMCVFKNNEFYRSEMSVILFSLFINPLLGLNIVCKI